tara:strand:+ start:2408 stop:11542 length:9135 start_codon:yes stop_codon:yes gene_type:complete
MTDIKRVKISHLIESQIPEFLSQESPLFKDFLIQYYESQEHQSGMSDLANNLAEYRKIGAFNNETLTVSTELTNACYAGDRTLTVTSTTGWPDTYGLLKIDNEVITYTSKTDTEFLGCARGFSGIDQISKEDAAEFANFAETNAAVHVAGSTVINLSNLFLQSFFTKFKTEFLPGFENRTFQPGTSVTNILTRAKDFYMSKGTDASYQILFKLLYGEEIELIKPIEKTLVPSANVYFKTKHVLVENLFGGQPLQTIGNFLYQDVAGIGTVSASIYNVEYRPINQTDFYEISLDSTSFDGSFTVPGKTKALEITPEDSETLVVDSTVGFGQSGTLLVKPREGANFLNLRYTDKTVNQFLGVTGISTSLVFGADILENKLAYAYAGFGQTSLLQFRLVNVIDEVDTSTSTNMQIGDSLKLLSFGRDLSDNPQFNNWIYNVPSSHTISDINQVNVNTFRISIFDSCVFYVDEVLKIKNDFGEETNITIKLIEYDSTNVAQVYSNTIVVQISGTIPSNPTVITKTVTKASHNNNYFAGVDNFPVGIQNSYLDKAEKFYYVASSGLPNYPIFATDNKVWVKTSGIEVVDGFGTPLLGGGFTYTVQSYDPAFDPAAGSSLLPHNYVTGDRIYWDNTTNSGINTGIYFVTAINQTDFYLSFSGSDVFAKKYIAVRTSTPGQYIYKSGWENKTLKNQKILRKYPFYKERELFDDPNKRDVNNRPVGLMANGVELFPPTVFDEQIFHGDVTSITVTNPGSGYDVITGPPLIIKDQQGFDALGHANVVGSFKEVKLVSPGIGYQEKPKITVEGGNGTGAVLESNLVRGRIVANFKADGSSVNTTDESITFEERHNFETGEGIIYDARGNTPIVNVVSGSTYYVGPVNETQIKLYNTPEDAKVGINTVNIGNISFGFHRFTTVKSKNTITKIYVKESGSGYSNRKVIVPARPVNGDVQSGISTSDDYILAYDHHFNNGEIVEYSTDGSVANGLSTSTQYAVRVIDPNKFKLCDVGVSSQRNFTNYDKNKTVVIRGLGSGKHTIKYPPISVKIESLSGLAATTVIKPEIDPIVLGSIDNVYLEQGGIGYGCTNIMDFHRRPDVGIATVTSFALLKPIIIGGSIIGVQILANGDGYREDSDILISSPTGSFGDVRPVITDSKITGVQILDGGIGYGVSDTTMILQNRGRSAKFIGNVREWKINQVQKNNNIINVEDSILTKPSTNPEFQLQTIGMYPPQKLRYQLGDNIDSGNLETPNAFHSPILGYAYDGNPIYGPYGYQNAVGGAIRRLSSGYILDTSVKAGLRPPGFAFGYFVNDYLFDNSGDLDIHGGRYCVTPQYPDGTYAYFYSVEVDSSGVAKPKFPYMVGGQFKDTPIEENFVTFFNQDIDLASRDLTRNISPYYLSFGNSDYELIDDVKDVLKQEFEVIKTKSSGISSVTIFSRGDGYKIDDPLTLDNSGTNGSGANIVVSEILGKQVSSVEIGVSTFTDTALRLEKRNIIGVTTVPHDIADGETVILSGIDTSQFTEFNGSQKVQIINRKVGLSTFVDTVTITGVSTHIFVTDTRGFEPSDHIGIGTEVMVVTGIDTNFSRLFVNRENYVGAAMTHAAGTNNVILKPNKFLFPVGTSTITQFTFDNYLTYFNPQESVGVGSTGTHYTITSTGFGTAAIQTVENRFVSQQRIYLRDHKFFTGQKLVYNAGIAGTSLVWAKVAAGATSGVGTEVLLEGDVYAVNFDKDHIGLTTVAFSTAADAIWFYNVASNSGFAHSLSTAYPKVTTKVERFFGEVGCSSAHQLSAGDIIKIDALPKSTESTILRYDPVIAKTTTKRVGFTYTSFSDDLTQINIGDQDLQSGDKVVYYDNGNTINGLINNETYFVLREDPDFIKLCKYKSDVFDSNPVSISTVTTASPSNLSFIAKINPPLNFTTGNTITFDVSDPSLTDMRLDFFEDITFNNRLDVQGTNIGGFNIVRDGISGLANATVTLNTELPWPSKTYYDLTPVVPSDTRKTFGSSDVEVTGRNNITFRDIILRNEHSVLIKDDKTFTFNLKEKPLESQKFVSRVGVSTITYSTTSVNARGPIFKTKINFPGKGYTVLPKVIGFASTQGQDGIVKVSSPEIGQIDIIERIKDGFDYPTDPTLLPFLAVPAIVDISGIARINEIQVLDGGRRYNQPPTLAVRGNSNVSIVAHVSGGSVDRVEVIQNAFEFKEPLSIITTNNSNGYDIDNITHSGTTVTAELLLDQQFNVPVTTGYASTETTLPFTVGDKVFVEGCRIKPASLQSGEANFNSADYDFSFYTVTGVNTTNATVQFSMADAPGISTVTLGTYDDDFTLGSIVNFNDMAKFNMTIIDDAKYLSGEKVTSTKFEGFVAENGWNVNISQLRLRDTIGTLLPGDVLTGQVSELKGNVRDVNRFSVPTTLGVTRDKVSKNDLNVGILNDFSQRLSDNFYFQKFSYSIKSNLPYNTWKESVKSIVHPSGFLEFSDLVIESDPKDNIDASNLPSSILGYVDGKLYDGPFHVHTRPDGSQVRMVGAAHTSTRHSIIYPYPPTMKVKAVDTTVDLILNIDNEIYMGKRDNFAMVTEDDALDDGSVQRIFFPEGRPIKSFIMNKTNKVLNLDDISSGFTGEHDRTGTLVGSRQFQLTTGGNTAFKKSYNAASSADVNLPLNIISIQNHDFQTGQVVNLDTQGGSKIGIAITSYTTGTKDIVMAAVTSGVGGSSLFENGYNVQIPGPVTGTAVTENPPGPVFRIYGFGSVDGGLPGFTTTGSGARFQVKFDFDQGTGQCISTAVVLISGGEGYIVGDTVGIAGTFLGGASPANDLLFPVTKTTGSRVGIQTTYSNVPSTNNGSGSGAIFNITRDSNLDISSVGVVTGGTGYASTNVITIAGTYIGGTTPTNNIELTPVECGTNIMPDELFVQKVDDVNFRVAGLSTSLPFEFTGLGTGTHLLKVQDPNKQALILIDNIIQTPLTNKLLSVEVSNAIGGSGENITVGTGIGSLTKGDVLKIDDEFLKVKQIGESTFAQAKQAIANKVVDDNFYYDTKRVNSNVLNVDTTTATMDDNPPY